MPSKLMHPALVTGAAVAVTVMMTAAAAGSTTPRASQAPPTTTPIKHVVVIIGENHSFDNMFATYQPPGHQKIWNLLSEGIVTKTGAPGPNFAKAAQLTASNTKSYTLTPKLTGPYKTLPQPNTTYVPRACDGQNGNKPDRRFPANLANGPFQITRYVSYFDTHIQFGSQGQCEFYGAYVGDPLHRFYQMWQQYHRARRPAADLGGRTPRATTTAPARPRRSTRARCPWASTTWPRATSRSSRTSR